MKSTVVLIPVLRRPHRVAPLLESLEASTPEPHRALFVCSPDDDAELEAVRAAGVDHVVLEQPVAPGDYARKINRGFEISSEPFVFLGADDLQFHPGWLPAALARMAEPAIGVVGTQDLGNPRVRAGKHATHSLVRRTYVERFGTIDEPGKVLHEGYAHEWVDDELVSTAKARGAWCFAGDSIVEHLHPHWGKLPTDALYDQHAERMQQGRTVFFSRRRLWSAR